MHNNLIDIISDGFKKQIVNQQTFYDALRDKTCPICGMELMRKEDWIFCPKHSTEVPICDNPYHIAQNQKTGIGWCQTNG